MICSRFVSVLFTHSEPTSLSFPEINSHLVYIQYSPEWVFKQDENVQKHARSLTLNLISFCEVEFMQSSFDYLDARNALPLKMKFTDSFLQRLCNK